MGEGNDDGGSDVDDNDDDDGGGGNYDDENAVKDVSGDVSGDVLLPTLRLIHLRANGPYAQRESI